MRLSELVAGVAVQPLTSGWESVRICDITEDSRTAVPGSLFVARPGLKADGRRFIADAVNAGASAVLTADVALDGLDHAGVAVLRCDDVPGISGILAERFYGNPSAALDMIAVTGTNGKSTITYLVWKILNQLGVRCGLIGTVITDDGREVASSSMTTPPSIELSRTLASMVEGGCRAAVMEVSSHALDQKRADALGIDVAVFTNLTGDHLDYHKTMDAYAAAKARLFQMLEPQGRAIVNAQDPWAGKVTGASRAPVIACAVTSDGAGPAEGSPAGLPPAPESGSAAVGQILSSGTSGMQLRLTGPWGVIEGHVPLIGRYNAMNVLQAVACCHAIGAKAEEIEGVLGRISAPPGRLEPVEVEGVQGPKVYVDYAHSDDSLRNALTAVRGAMRGDPKAGKLWAVFGCGGDKDRTKRPRMGKAAAEIADLVVVTSDNPRSEQPGAIVKEVLAGIAAEFKEKVLVHVERDQAIMAAIQGAGEHDVIVIAGKGHETEQIRLDAQGKMVTLHFDDREHAAEQLRARGMRSATTSGI